MDQARYSTHDSPNSANFTDLELRYGDRIETMLANWLDDEALAAKIRRPIMEALSGKNEELRLGPAALEDWIFGEARREARQLVGPTRIPGVIPVMRVQPDDHADTHEFDAFDDWDDEPQSWWRTAIPARWIWFGVFLAMVGGSFGYAWLNTQRNLPSQVTSVAPRPAVRHDPAPPAPPAPIAAAVPQPSQDLQPLDAEVDSPPLPAPAVPEPIRALEAPAPLPPPDPLPTLAMAPPTLPAPVAEALPVPPPPLAAAPADPVARAVPPAGPAVPDPAAPIPVVETLRTPPAPMAAAPDSPVAQSVPPADPIVPDPAPLTPAEPGPARVFIHYSAGDPLSEQRAQRLAALQK